MKIHYVPASETNIERMFNISGFVFNPRLRGLDVDNF